MQHILPRFILAGLSGGTGKTIVSLALARAFSRRGLRVAPFKKGPDYIDARWLALAAGRPCSNLDPFFHADPVIRSLFWHKSQGSDLSLVEGNRGLFDGKDEHGSCSTAELARKLDAPVILTIDCTKMTRTVAAILLGCASFEPDLRLAGVILNRTAGERHRSVLRRSIEEYTDIPVLGMLPKIGDNPIPERHMGLMSDQEFRDGGSDLGQPALDSLAAMAEEWLNLDAIRAVAECAPPFKAEPAPLFPGPPAPVSARIGYVRDAALWFYYPENLDALTHAGAELVRLSLLAEDPWPDMDGLYLGGGFPEVFAGRIAANKRVLATIRSLSQAGMPIYAECGGFMVLCESLDCVDAAGKAGPHVMTGVIPAATSLCAKPQGLGYTESVVEVGSPFFLPGETVLGHEFHYSVCLADPGAPLPFSLRMLRGSGIGGGRDGVLYENTFAGYTHIHALAAPAWAPRFVAAAARWRGSVDSGLSEEQT
ncbi:MAG: cobyrinate a,c-diamide synthase [Pseudodesulfovibrio sp.]|uniref:Cobyrinate a,c-diamide synthase n=1 Tax=Pseudodesulfovibrio aespoeensis (strain ATCC 700646 / DSM 10631 / Aspo-2) TaxID=643562 RepID=E6VZA4_PSEA9|nr:MULTISPECIES: cobyrinate a,c-diamide synthase [Pseudodesulfovibrio]MBU4474355.1 cobyrinate a,c-diamide synthase [Pseudomonadota bacterium]MCG2732160.1 cobyrinate a,c-diamide synthase [Pseudodesulfovibrio aespoeensis]ADU63976.1 cobyrinic acid a,c-diamide synthase [Pseudodesulfovibrio aespoeensis Aspo-2]MBU4516999.1 cobyrinate a,c-diamide synthase [Pseudomonadota bacterium]MBU4523250.1 cobyrinate a,c-diamide synthase [Pseudomonadota bacterium]